MVQAIMYKADNTHLHAYINLTRNKIYLEFLPLVFKYSLA